MAFHIPMPNQPHHGYQIVGQAPNQLDRDEKKLFKGHEMTTQPILPIVNMITWLIALFLIGLTIFKPSIIQSLNQSIDQSFTSSTQPSINTFTVEYMRENGVMLPNNTRFKPVSDESVNLFKQHVETHLIHDIPERTIILSVVNFGYIDFALNWLCYLQRHNLTNWLIGVVDKESYNRLHVLGYGKHIISLATVYDDKDLHQCGGIYTHSYRQACFNKQTLYKARLVLTALLAGYTAVLSDMDIIFTQNPFLYLPMQHDWEMALEPHEFCTGFYLNKPTALNVEMQSQVIAGMLNRPELDDQTIYNEWIHYHRTIGKSTMDRHLFPLNSELFPNGQRFGVHHGVIQHNNWVQGADNKREKAKRLFLWLHNANQTDEAVNEFLAKNQVKETDQSIKYRSGSLLQCDACRTCFMFEPNKPKLRNTWPGPLLNSTFDYYRGQLSKKHP